MTTTPITLLKENNRGRDARCRGYGNGGPFAWRFKMQSHKRVTSVTTLGLLVGIVTGVGIVQVPTALSEDKHLSVGVIRWEKDFALIHDKTAFYPRAAELADGSLIAGFTHPLPGEGKKAIAIRESRDDGKTWNDYHRIGEDKEKTDYDIFPLQLEDGRVLAAFRHHTPDKGIYRIEVCASANKGADWTFLGTVALGTVGLWEPFLLQMPNGQLQAYYSSEEGLKPDQRIEMKTSQDGGETWKNPVTVARKKGSRDGMPGVIRLADGTLFAVFEAQDVSPFRFVIRAVRSKDNGRTWSATRELVYKPQHRVIEPWAAGAPYVVQLRDGRILVSFQTDEDVVYEKGKPDFDPRHPRYDYLRHTSFKYVVSNDNGRTWMPPTKLAGDPKTPANWNALYVLRNGKLLALSTIEGKVWCKMGTVAAGD
jgi:BNR repeat-like domain